MADGPSSMVVPVKSAWKSKINWTQVISAASMALAYFAGHDVLTPDQQAAIIVTIGLVQSGVTWVLKTWFTNSVHPSSVN